MNIFILVIEVEQGILASGEYFYVSLNQSREAAETDLLIIAEQLDQHGYWMNDGTGDYPKTFAEFVDWVGDQPVTFNWLITEREYDLENENRETG